MDELEDELDEQFYQELLAPILGFFPGCRYLTGVERRDIRRKVRQRLSELTTAYNASSRDQGRLEREENERGLLDELRDLDIRKHVPSPRTNASEIKKIIADRIQGIKRRVCKGGRAP